MDELSKFIVILKELSKKILNFSENFHIFLINLNVSFDSQVSNGILSLINIKSG